MTAKLLQQGSAEATQQHLGCAPAAAEVWCCHQPHGCWSCGYPGQLRLVLMGSLVVTRETGTAVNRASEGTGWQQRLHRPSSCMPVIQGTSPCHGHATAWHSRCQGYPAFAVLL